MAREIMRAFIYNEEDFYHDAHGLVLLDNIPTDLALEYSEHVLDQLKDSSLLEKDAFICRLEFIRVRIY